MLNVDFSLLTGGFLVFITLVLLKWFVIYISKKFNLDELIGISNNKFVKRVNKYFNIVLIFWGLCFVYSFIWTGVSVDTYSEIGQLDQTKVTVSVQLRNDIIQESNLDSEKREEDLDKKIRKEIREAKESYKLFKE